MRRQTTLNLNRCRNLLPVRILVCKPQSLPNILPDRAGAAGGA
jgi:hypothetical protein